jgi:26S proteasome regulatory subunit N9
MSPALSAIRSRYHTLGSNIDKLANLAALKQIHELTVEIVQFLDAAILLGMSGKEMVEFFEGFVDPLASKISPLSLVKILGRCLSPSDVDAGTALAVISKHEAVLGKSKDAIILSRVLIADIHMKKASNLAEARTVLDTLGETLQDPMYAHTVSGSARGQFHLAASELYMSLGNDLEFYNHVVNFLSYTPANEISPETLSRATKQASVIALIHPEINDFGDLLALPAFSSMTSWTVDFLRAIHFGNFDAFDAAVKAHSAELQQSAEKELMAKIDTSLRRKLTMISLAELAGFVAPEKNRRLTFQQISDHCRVGINEVEELVMATMGSGKLIDGVIDQVDSTVLVTCVKPRVLDKDRIVLLKSRIESWADRTQSLVSELKDLTPELLIA